LFDTESAFLKHYGVLGMKWGKRKTSSTSPGTSAPKRALTAEHINAQAVKKKRAGELTNAELKQAIERMNLEKQYRQLNPTKAASSRKLAQDIIGNVGKQVVSETLKDAAKKGVEVAITTALKRGK
jgi:hypothetical protein